MATEKQNFPNRPAKPDRCYFFASVLSASFVADKSLPFAHPFMQNKPNFPKSQMNVSDYITKAYDKRTLGQRGKSKPNSNPNKPNSKISKTALTLAMKKICNKIRPFLCQKNKPNSNPIQTQTNPIRPQFSDVRHFLTRFAEKNTQKYVKIQKNTKKYRVFTGNSPTYFTQSLQADPINLIFTLKTHISP